MKIVKPYNLCQDGTARTIKANYHKVSLDNFVRGGGSFAQTGVVEYETESEEDV